MKSNTTTTTITENRRPLWEQSAEEIERTADWITHRTLVTANSTNYNTFVEKLIKSAYTDKMWRENTDRTARADHSRQTAAKARATATAAKAQTKRITISDDDRLTAYDLYAHADGVSREELATANDIDKQQSELTASYREDIRQHLITTIYAVNRRINLELAKGRKLNEDAEYLLVKKLFNSARKYMQTFRGVTTLDKSHTDSQLLTTSQALRIICNYNIDPISRPHTKILTKGGFYTLESKPMKAALKSLSDEQKRDIAMLNDTTILYHTLTDFEPQTTHRPAYAAHRANESALIFWQKMTENEKTAALGLDPTIDEPLTLVYHSNTVAICDSLPDTDKTPITADTADSGTEYDITELISAADLTPRNRRILQTMTTEQAAQHAQAATNEYLTQRTAEIKTTAKTAHQALRIRESKETAENVYSTALFNYAFDVEGIPTEDARKKTKSRIIKAIRTAKHNPDTQHVNAIALMNNRFGIRAAEHSERADLIQWTKSAPIATAEPPKITEQEYFKKLKQAEKSEDKQVIERKYLFTINFINNDESKQKRAYYKAAQAEIYRNSQIDNSTEQARARAEQAAQAYQAKQAATTARIAAQAAEKARAAQAEQLAKAERAKARAKADADKKLQNIPESVRVWKANKELFQTWTATERKQHLEYIKYYIEFML